MKKRYEKTGVDEIDVARDALENRCTILCDRKGNTIGAKYGDHGPLLYFMQGRFLSGGRPELLDAARRAK